MYNENFCCVEKFLENFIEKENNESKTKTKQNKNIIPILNDKIEIDLYNFQEFEKNIIKYYPPETKTISIYLNSFCFPKKNRFVSIFLPFSKKNPKKRK